MSSKNSAISTFQRWPAIGNPGLLFAALFAEGFCTNSAFYGAAAAGTVHLQLARVP
jgi:hypothetical protein